MHSSPEKELFPAPVILSVVGREHLVVLPGIDRRVERSPLLVSIVRQVLRLDKNGIHIHVHAADELEGLCLGVVGSVQALDDLAVLIAHGGSVLENGHGVFCIIVKVTRPQRVVLLVLQLHHASAELSPVFIYIVIQLVTAQDGLVLQDLHVSERVYYSVVNVPDCRIAYKISVVVEEPCRTVNFPDLLPFLLHYVHGLRTHQTHKAVRIRLLLGKRRKHCPE